MFLYFFACHEPLPSVDEKHQDGVQSEVVAEQNTVIFPLLSMQSNLSSLNFFDRQTASIRNIIESHDEQQFIDGHQVGSSIYVLKEDLHSNQPTLLQRLHEDGEVEQEFELEQAHHSIAPFEGKIAYLGVEEYASNGRMLMR